MYFIQILVIACIVSENLVQIDHNGLNWTFLTSTVTFNVTKHH